jgi:hypothetical protein
VASQIASVVSGDLILATNFFAMAAQVLSISEAILESESLTSIFSEAISTLMTRV